MTPTLVVLAAGLGSRFGGLKQLDPMGPAGETLLDYAVYDALRCGFGRVVFVIRKDFEEQFKEAVGSRYADVCEVTYAFQDPADLPGGRVPPAGRVKPWGTGHALWCARQALNGPFGVINADDFYGRDAFRRLGAFLASGSTTERPQFAMAGFRLANTLSDHGAVARGLCDVTAQGKLRSVVECTGIRRKDIDSRGRFQGRDIVSMNCWAFTPAIFPLLERRLVAFLDSSGQHATAEFYLPSAVSSMIAKREVDVTVLRTSAAWFGVTYREDRSWVVAAIRELVGRGEYPRELHLSAALWT